MTTPIGAGPRLFITSTTAPVKSESCSSGRATNRIAVRPFGSSADVGHDVHNSSSAHSTPDIRHRRRKPLLTGDTFRVITSDRSVFARCYALTVAAGGGPHDRRAAEL